MNKTKTMKYIILVFFISCTISFNCAWAQELSIYTENNPPTSYLRNGKLEGMAVKIVQRILQHLGQPDTIELVPWARGYNLALKKENIALFAATRLPQREKLFKWVGPIYSQTWGFYKRKGNPLQITTLEDAKKVDRIGVYRADAKKQYLENKGFANLIATADNTTNVRHLMRGNITLWISSDLNMPYIARQAGVEPDQIERAYAIKSVDNYIVFSVMTSDKIVEAWQKALDAIKKDTTSSALFTK